MAIVYKTDFRGVTEPRRGKVRDIFETEKYILIVATDRISAFDVIMNEPIPEKGKILSQISTSWFNRTKNIIRNHFLSNYVADYPYEFHKYSEQLEGRSMLVKKCKPLPIECIVRGYVAGSGWKEYKSNKSICGISLPEGLLEFSRLPEPIFTPSTKAEVGHDENISPEQAGDMIGKELAAQIADVSIKLYKFGAEYLEKNNIILADTKFEFGTDEDGELFLIDEALTPDSSRFWLKEEYSPGKPQINFDKQVLRDYLESLDWNKQPPPPKLPQEIIDKTLEKYKEAFRRIVGHIYPGSE
ncbi:MAG: phosphoribosylaminoimidazolesuccinocarboxamide synthase [Ignavibacteria bacterium GWB2_35_12]|nr:MAG: phosphoribosylaminoimidazolesuccinocarboxamide synthase [Ignavibacteria bacterium GWA2_35_8]OGU41975.1 MAG: phosphoribosylaminoimidazolesuccinocarboxamide synthase [Ignavibacteria bacterium GWB2_35_12]OGU96058.1 MAG: phosphoribosylaminoimidazolesuccinocarboxamide synthase [Ignavibacteria bacterium RIFOXYA2_FULL_35_10]OGV24431.1 MAG: phosphoribosylaminoimidazolesuccinocarboxamide synthase [Ignavibacteria bacterium RIFOXYC2_FULL_35_21]